MEGQIRVNGLEEGWYRIIEVENGNKNYQVINYPYADIYVYENTENTWGAPLYILNDKQVGIDISGFIWEDFGETKGTVKNNIYDKDTEPGVNGVKVTLKDSNGNTVTNLLGDLCETTSEELGINDNIEGGEYKFTNIDSSQLEKYHVEFEYNGLIYEAVETGIGNAEVNSKAHDVTREDLDKQFKNGITNKSQNSVQIEGTDISVEYTGGTTKAINKSNISGCDVMARTDINGEDSSTNFTLDKIYAEGNINYINLGIYEKPQADLRVDKDVEELTLEFGEVNTENGHRAYSYTYKYHQETDNEINPVQWNFGVQFQTNTGGYQRKIYKSDIEYNNGNSIDIYMTYKIQLTNEGVYNSKVNSIVEYYSTDYKIVEAWTKNQNVNKGLDIVNVSSYNDNYNVCTIETDMNIGARYGDWLYIKFQVTRDAISKLFNQNEINEYATTEITHYTVYKDDFENSVAAVDIDSVPGNTILGNVETYEDDTDAAPNFRIVLNENGRTIQGTVFEDEATESSGTGKVREGNGIFDERETRISNVSVTLKGVDNTTEITQYTDENGDYTIAGFIPGQYEIIYKWGDDKYRVQTYKGTIYDSERDQKDEYWYRSDTDTRKTDAIDNYKERIDIDAQMAEYTDRNIYNILDDAYNGENSKNIITSMNSVTPTMQFEIEYDDNQIDEYIVKNIDFGIIERAKQILNVEKKVTNFKITSANGPELVDATVDESGKLQGSLKYLADMRPIRMKAEIDNELIQGATLEVKYKIKYENNSELDYMTEDFYKYGIVPVKSGSSIPDETKLVTLTSYGVLDYLDENFGYDANKNEKWKKITDVGETWYTDRDKAPEGIDTSKLLYAEGKLSGLKPVEPGKQDSIDLNVSKLLAVSDELTFNNTVDTVQISKSETITTEHRGSIIENFPSAKAEEVIITPSTGDNKGYVLLVITGIASLIILGVGIYFIKIKVID